MPKMHEDLPLLTPVDKEHYKKNPLAKWVWRATPGACVDCVARDGRKYFYPDVEKLKLPHPNCKCKVVLVTEEAPENFIAKTLDGLKDTAFGTADALADIATSESWGKTASGTADAMDEVWDDPAGRAALLFAGATMLPGVIAGAQAAPGMFYGAMEMLPAGAAVGGIGSSVYSPGNRFRDVDCAVYASSNKRSWSTWVSNRVLLEYQIVKINTDHESIYQLPCRRSCYSNWGCCVCE